MKKSFTSPLQQMIRSLMAAAYLNIIIMQQQEKQIIEYWFKANLFGSPVCVKIKMVERDEEKAKALFEEVFHPAKASVIEKPKDGKFFMVGEEWEL